MKTRQDVIHHLKQHFTPPKLGQTVAVDFFKPEDAMGVVSTCYAVYGAGYPVDTYYLPEKLAEENAKGNIHSVVVRTQNNEVVGHGALFHSSSPFKGMYEAGQYIIQKAYRGGGTALNINHYVTRRCPEKYDVEAMYGEPVTNHTITQKMGQDEGWVETALEMDLMPAQAYASDETVKGRVATLLTFNIRKDRPHTLYLPQVYADRIKQDLTQLSFDRKLSAPRTETPELKKSRTLPEFFEFAGVGRLQVLKMGKDINAVIQAFENEIQEQHYHVAQVFLPLDQPLIQKTCMELNKNGFFYGGYLPRWFDSDGILLQKIYGRPNFEDPKLYSEKAKQLMDYIKKDWQRVS